MLLLPAPLKVIFPNGRHERSKRPTRITNTRGRNGKKQTRIWPSNPLRIASSNSVTSPQTFAAMTVGAADWGKNQQKGPRTRPAGRRGIPGVSSFSPATTQHGLPRRSLRPPFHLCTVSTGLSSVSAEITAKKGKRKNLMRARETRERREDVRHVLGRALSPIQQSSRFYAGKMPGPY